MNSLSDWAMQYWNEGLCVIPIQPREKKPAIIWEEFQTRRSTAAEVRQWWDYNRNYNIGAVHGVNNYAMIDIDHDSGALAEMKRRFKHLMSGRIELSGSGEGYHIPMFLEEFPNLGHDIKKNRPQGNKSWRTTLGLINIRTRFCQTVLKPSVHPSGKLYEFYREGKIVRISYLDPVIDWLNQLAPLDAPVIREKAAEPKRPATQDDLKLYFPDIVAAFRAAGYNGEIQIERNGEKRIMGNGGLLVDEDRGTWYSFREEMGGDVIDAFGFIRYGASWNRYDKIMFYQVASQMREVAGINTARKPSLVSETKQPVKFSNYWRKQ